VFSKWVDFAVVGMKGSVEPLLSNSMEFARRVKSKIWGQFHRSLEEGDRKSGAESIRKNMSISCFRCKRSQMFGRIMGMKLTKGSDGFDPSRI
jgi:hypothetical protein